MCVYTHTDRHRGRDIKLWTDRHIQYYLFNTIPQYDQPDKLSNYATLIYFGPSRKGGKDSILHKVLPFLFNWHWGQSLFSFNSVNSMTIFSTFCTHKTWPRCKVHGWPSQHSSKSTGKKMCQWPGNSCGTTCRQSMKRRTGCHSVTVPAAQCKPYINVE